MRERSREFWSQLRPLLLWNLTLVLGLAWLPGAAGTAYNLWVRRVGEPA
ncbi:MAG: hypothetical protein RL499_1670 [Actinomycetota bacterium]|jgi:hypothetical protein